METYGDLVKSTDAAHRALLKNPENAYKENKIKLLCAQPPHSEWLQKNKFANNAEYLPIDKVEYLLDSLFKEWKIEILNVIQTERSATVAVRVHYQIPNTGEWFYHDGVAAEPFKREAMSKDFKDTTEKDTFDQMVREIAAERDIARRVKMQREYYELKKSRPLREDAEKAAFQIAKSAAIKDATDHLGRLFGRDLNRKYTINVSMDSEPQPYEQPKVKVQHTEEPAPVTTAPTEEPTFTLF
jgi:hypothetical protein